MNTNNGRSDESQTEQIDNEDTFSAIAGAMTSGNMDELDRLMAVKDAEDSEGDGKNGQVEDDTKTVEDQKNDDDQNSDDDTDEAAKKAASPDASKKPADDELAALKAELHSLRSKVGRVDYLQRTVQELQRNRVPDTRTTTQTPPATPKTKELPEDLQKRITALKEIDPEMADTFEVFAKTLAQQTEQEASSVRETFEQRQRENEELQFLHQQKQELYKLVPRCDEIFSMPEWQEWKEILTPGQRGMAQSKYAQDVAYAISAFANYMQSKQGVHPSQSTAAGGGDPNANTQVDTHDDSNNTAVQDARARKVAAAADVKSSAAKKESTLDAEAYFKEMYKKIGTENHILAK